ncbi:MAG: type VI secretion system baseplate subunit TssG [Syntrophaceae bacterium]
MLQTELTETLCREGRRYSFIQAVRLLRLLLRRQGEPERELWKKIRVRPELSLSFPDTDIVSIEDRNDHFRISTTFLGLYGTSSPLPSFYTEDLLEEQSNDTSISRDFLDVVNSRMYSLLFQCWSHYKMFFKFVEEPEFSAVQRWLCLLGFENKGLLEKISDPLSMMRYAGLLTQFPRSAEALRCMLSDALGESGASPEIRPEISIEQCVARLVPIPEDQHFLLGVSGSTLGQEMYLGEQVVDSAGKFRVRIGPIPPERLELYRPDRELFSRIRELVNYYLDQPAVWDLEIIVSGGGGAMQIGSPESCRLGWNTWSFTGETNTGVRSVVVPGNYGN